MAMRAIIQRAIFASGISRKCLPVAVQFSTKPKFSPTEEPPFMVSSDVMMNPRDIKIAHLSEDMLVEIYNLHKSNPEEWTASNLAAKFGSSEYRMKGAIFMMKHREEFKKERGLDQITEKWRKIHRLHKENTSLEDLAAQFELSQSEITKIIDIVSEDVYRQSLVDAGEAHHNAVLQHFAELGADVSFNESPSMTRHSNLENSYDPELFGDEGFVYKKLELLKRLKEETKAVLRDGQDAFYWDKLIAQSKEKPVLPKQPDTTPIESRFKFAFRDIGVKFEKPVKIRSRTGV